jgi:hypothetical protein
MSPRTIFLGRLIGLYCLLIGLTMVMRKQAMVEMVTALIHNPPAAWLAGLLAMTAGLAIVLGHNVWSGGALPVIITLLGWIALLKGLLFLLLPPEAEAGIFLQTLHYEQFFNIYTAISLLLGIYVSYRAWHH